MCDENFAVTEMNKLLNNSKWFKTKSLWRLCNPLQDLPNGLDHSCATFFIIVGCKADPLFDDALHFHNELTKVKANALFVQPNASHALGHLFDSKTSKVIYKSLSKQFS